METITWQRIKEKAIHQNINTTSFRIWGRLHPFDLWGLFWNLEALQLSRHWEVVRSFAWAEEPPTTFPLTFGGGYLSQISIHKKMVGSFVGSPKVKRLCEKCSLTMIDMIHMMHIWGSCTPFVARSTIAVLEWRVGSVKIKMPPPFLDISPCLTLWKISLRERPMLPVGSEINTGSPPAWPCPSRPRGHKESWWSSRLPPATDGTSRERFTSSRPGIEETSCFSRIDLWKAKYIDL